jgi:hypothetical protein
LQLKIRFEHHQSGVLVGFPFPLHQRGEEPFDVHFDKEWTAEPSDSVLLDRLMVAHRHHIGMATVRQDSIFIYGAVVLETKRLVFEVVEANGSQPVEDVWYVPV